jgi:hypothetical protein
MNDYLPLNSCVWMYEYNLLSARLLTISTGYERDIVYYSSYAHRGVSWQSWKERVAVNLTSLCFVMSTYKCVSRYQRKVVI